MSDDSATSQWQERTIERTLKTARERAISRGDRFIEAAAELLRTTGKPDFTVQQVVERSGMSLRSFYHHFATKDDLLLALMEETIRSYVGSIQPRIEAVEDPIERIRTLLATFYGDKGSDDPAARGLALFHWHLANNRTDEFTSLLQPQVELIRNALQAGADAGLIRNDLSVDAMATLLVNTLLALLDMRVLGVAPAGHTVTPDELLRWCMTAITTPAER